ncbi:MAG: alpha/beta hydrolase [Pseudomonadota bacterium]
MRQWTIDGVEVVLEGEGEHTIVMLHGWPDHARLWDGQVAALRGRFRCARFTLPGFAPGQPRRAHSLAETTALIERVVTRVSPDRPVTLLLHDWGCMFGYHFQQRHPDLVAGVIACDVGDAVSPACRAAHGWRAKLMIAGYQLWLALAWRIGGAPGDRMSRSMARFLGAPAAPETVHSGMNYPYYITWTGAYGGYRDMVPFAADCPTMFIYGTRKPFMFHSPQWLAQLTGRPDNQVLALPTGHWVMLRQADVFNRAMLAWLDQRDTPMRAAAV